jgi:redox-sensitive bicupin YhaK (pirin superfamily)
MEKIKEIFTKKVILFGFLLAICLCLLTYFLQVVVFPYFSNASGIKARMVITPADLSNIDQVQQESEIPTEAVQLLPGVVSLGMTVQVHGTGEDGLRMRAAPGTDADVIFLANEGENFLIIDGPVIQDSLIWWKIQSLQDAEKVGWSVQDYLAGLQP